MFLIFSAVLLFASVNAVAKVPDFSDYFEVDLEKDKMPMLEELKKVNDDEKNYNRKFESIFDLSGDYNAEFAVKIAAYGMQEKRIKDFNEDNYVSLFSKLPKKYYQYFGPMLFEVPGFPKKILNLPEIKKTKNKFPTIIAKQLKEIKDLELLSPTYYYLLMPEVWPDYEPQIENPKKRRYAVKYVYDDKFYDSLKKIVKPEDFGMGKTKEVKLSKSNLRTLKVEKNSLITAADMSAFVDTVDEVNEWYNKNDNLRVFTSTTILLMNYEKKDDIGKYVPQGLKDMANPCARFVQKSKILGKDKEIAEIVAKKGMSLDEWAYVCDKSVKAYRVANVNIGVVKALNMFRKDLLSHKMTDESISFQNYVNSLMHFAFHIYKAPLKDVLEYRKVKNKFDAMMKKTKHQLFGHPVLVF